MDFFMRSYLNCQRAPDSPLLGQLLQHITPTAFSSRHLETPGYPNLINSILRSRGGIGLYQVYHRRQTMESAEKHMRKELGLAGRSPFKRRTCFLIDRVSFKRTHRHKNPPVRTILIAQILFSVHSAPRL